MLNSELTKSISLSVQTTPKVIDDEKLSNSLLCYSSGGMQEKSVWVIPGSDNPREPMGTSVFFFQPLLPMSPLPISG